tara:strand:- start:13595 stop:13933 length:339 start_codon:yes stop_codon:yes gene_type:complete
MLQLSKILNIKCKDQKISKVINDFYTENNIFDKSSLVITLIYLKRYSEKVNISSKELEKLIESCLILSNKFIADIEIKSCGQLEEKIIKTLNWNLFIDVSEYNHFSKIIESY